MNGLWKDITNKIEMACIEKSCPGGSMKKTLIFYKPEYADLAIKLRDNYRTHDHGEADIVSEEEHDDIEYAGKCTMTKLYL